MLKKIELTKMTTSPIGTFLPLLRLCTVRGAGAEYMSRTMGCLSTEVFPTTTFECKCMVSTDRDSENRSVGVWLVSNRASNKAHSSERSLTARVPSLGHAAGFKVTPISHIGISGENSVRETGTKFHFLWRRKLLRNRALNRMLDTQSGETVLECRLHATGILRNEERILSATGGFP